MEGLDLKQSAIPLPLASAKEGSRFVARTSSAVSDDLNERLISRLKSIAKKEIRVLVIDCEAFEVAIIGPSQKLLLGGPQYRSILHNGVTSLGISLIEIASDSVVFVKSLTEKKRYAKSFMSRVRDWAHPFESHFFK